MVEILTAENAKIYVVDAIAACWICVRGVKEAIVSDTFEEIVRTLNHRLLDWTNPEAYEYVRTWTDTELWNLLRRRFGGVENPVGVVTFAKNQETTALQRRDNLYRLFPRMIGFIEQTLPQLD